jgi:hypothetical protein
MATIMPMTTKTTIATCIQIQVGDTATAYYRWRQLTSPQVSHAPRCDACALTIRQRRAARG